MWVIRLTWVETGLPPQTTIRSLSAISRLSTPRFTPDPGHPAGIGQRDADGRELARVFHDIAQAVDAITLHMPHRAGVEIRPDRRRAVALCRLDEALGHDVERVVPADRREPVPTGALRPDPAHGRQQPVRMMLPLA
ncbi:MAG: hypothetical protein WDN69_10450 [Aliidongia sp.]